MARLSTRIRRNGAIIGITALLAVHWLVSRNVSDQVLGLWLLALLPIATALAVVWWRALDEAAREAHKFAWFWGGSAGMLLGTLGFLYLSPAILDRGWLPAGGPLFLIETGILAVLVPQMAGYLIAWAGWWIARR